MTGWNNRGFTLIELLITIVITLITIFMVYNVFIQSRRNYAVQEQITDMHQNLRVSMEFITRQLRNISTITALNCQQNNSSITFTSVAEMGTATGGTATTLTDSTKSWDSGDWEGATVVIVSGAGSGQSRTIRTNTSKVLTVLYNWTTNPDPNTSLYVIKMPIEFSRDTVQDELNYRKVKVGVSSHPMPLTQNITNFTLQGFDQAGASTCDPNSISKFVITVTARTANRDPLKGNNYHYYTAKTSFLLRE